MDKKVPTYTVTLNGTDIEDLTTEGGEEGAAARRLQMIRVDLRRQAPSSAELQFNNHETNYDSKESFQPGVVVKVSLGYEGSEKKVLFEGEIIGMQLTAIDDGPKVLTIRAFDYLHRLTRGRKTQTFLDQKFSQIVTKIAQDRGLTPDCEDTTFIREYVIQHNQTDLDFTRGIAGWLDFDLRICHLTDAKKLRFAKPDVTADPVTTLVYANPQGDDEVLLRKFVARQTLARVVSSVIVRGWSPKDKKEIIGKASKIYGKMDGDQTSADEITDKWGETDRQLVDYKVFTQEEADKIAETKLNEYARTFLRADIEMQGLNTIGAGAVVKLKELGEKFNGNYLVERVQHIFKTKVDVGGGYTTRIFVARCGW